MLSPQIMMVEKGVVSVDDEVGLANEQRETFNEVEEWIDMLRHRLCYNIYGFFGTQISV